MSRRRANPEPVPIRLLAPRRIPMTPDEEARAVAALVAVLVEADRMAERGQRRSDDGPTAA